MEALKKKVGQRIAEARDEMRALLAEHGGKKIHEVTLAQAYGGMRGIPCMVWEQSWLDPEEGIRYRGYSIPELLEKLPRAKPDGQPLPEGLFYLLLTGELPTKDDVDMLSAGIAERRHVPNYVIEMLNALPQHTHAMTKFSMAILSMQPESVFGKRYREGLDKADAWEPTFDDVLNLLGKVPTLAALVYLHTVHGHTEFNEPASRETDWAGRLACQLGHCNDEFKECLRLYMTLHTDHEGGNVSAHAAHLVGSAWSDPYYALSAAMNGLAGPLHGLANQEVLRWVRRLMDRLGGVPTEEQLRDFLWETLNSGQVVPGFGHAVLRKTDPRYMAQREFALRYLPDEPLFQVTSLLYDVAPQVLMEHGKARNPWPNLDAHSGCLLYHYGITQYDFYTVLFGCARAFGVLTSLVWSRGLGLPIERPKSFTTEYAKAHFI